VQSLCKAGAVRVPLPEASKKNEQVGTHNICCGIAFHTLPCRADWTNIDLSRIEFLLRRSGEERTPPLKPAAVLLLSHACAATSAFSGFGPTLYQLGD